MIRLLALIFLCSCMKSSDELEGITEEVLKRKEGVDITIQPVEKK